jgi:deazaflavin-dependent oxidoreductase (nitroreductase family)
MAGPLARPVHLAIGLLGTSRPFTAVHRALYRRLGGRGVLRHGLGVDAILLTTTGRRTGERRTVPLFAFPLDAAGEGPGAAASDEPGRWVVVASNAGRHRGPAWYGNLRAESSVEVQLGDRRWRAEARTAAGDERERLWTLVAAGYPGYDVYRDRTDRPIPIVVLEPR